MRADGHTVLDVQRATGDASAGSMPAGRLPRSAPRTAQDPRGDVRHPTHRPERVGSGDIAAADNLTASEFQGEVARLVILRVGHAP
jgi:hypothetical protein